MYSWFFSDTKLQAKQGEIFFTLNINMDGIFDDVLAQHCSIESEGKGDYIC